LTIVIYAMISVMKHYSLLVGVGRYSFILVVAIMLVWTAEYVLLHSTSQFSPFMGTSIFAALAIAVIINEHNAYGVRKAAPALALSLLVMTCVEIGGIATVQTATHQPVNLHNLTVSAESRRMATQ